MGLWSWERNWAGDKEPGCSHGNCLALDSSGVSAMSGSYCTSTTNFLIPALHHSKDSGSFDSKRKRFFCSIARTYLEGFRGSAETWQVMEVILQWEQKEEESIPASHFSRQEVTPWGRNSPLPPCYPHTLNSKCTVRYNHSGCRSCQSTFWLKKQRTSLRFALQLLPHALKVTRQGRRITHVCREQWGN